MGEQLNSTVDLTETSWPFLPLKAKFGILLGCLSATGACMNILALIVTIRIGRKHRGSLNNLIIALAFADFYLLVFGCAPTLLVYATQKWVGGTIMCNYQGFVVNTGTIITGGLTVALAVDRTIAVTRPFLYREMAKVGRHWLVVLAVIFLGLIMGILPLVGVGKYKRNLTGTFCTIDMFALVAADVGGAVLYCILGFLMVIITIYCNVRVLYQIKVILRDRSHLSSQRQLAIRKSDTTDTRRRERMQFRRERNLAVTVLAMSIVFLLCYFPYMVRIICNLAQTMKDALLDVQIARLLLLNSVINPFIYTFFRRRAKIELRRWFRSLTGVVTGTPRSSTRSSYQFGSDGLGDSKHSRGTPAIIVSQDTKTSDS